jgi:ribosomal protein S18 acetylase RimI-like enzyme
MKRTMGKILYTVNESVTPEEVGEVFRASGIRRPSNDPGRIAKMISNANLIVCARDSQKLVGIARALTDFSYCCYISDLAVDRAYSGKGIGKELLRKVQEAAGEEAMILLLSTSKSESYYPRIGFKKAENAWRIPRKR